MNNVGGMHEVDGTQQIVEYYLEMLLRESEAIGLGILEKLLKVHGLVVHDQVDSIEVVGRFRDDYIKQLGSENISFHLRELLHDLNFSDHFFESV